MAKKNQKRDSDVAKSLKQEAQRLADITNTAHSLKLSRAKSLEFTARIHGYQDWNTACKSAGVPAQPHDALQRRCMVEVDRLITASQEDFSDDLRPKIIDEIGTALLAETPAFGGHCLAWPRNCESELQLPYPTAPRLNVLPCWKVLSYSAKKPALGRAFGFPGSGPSSAKTLFWASK